MQTRIAMDNAETPAPTVRIINLEATMPTTTKLVEERTMFGSCKDGHHRRCIGHYTWSGGRTVCTCQCHKQAKDLNAIESITDPAAPPAPRTFDPFYTISYGEVADTEKYLREMLAAKYELPADKWADVPVMKLFAKYLASRIEQWLQDEVIEDIEREHTGRARTFIEAIDKELKTRGLWELCGEAASQ